MLFARIEVIEPCNSTVYPYNDPGEFLQRVQAFVASDSIPRYDTRDRNRYLP